MLIVSFNWTAEAFLHGHKSCTRRYWADDYASKFQEGMVYQAWNQLPRAHGHSIGLIRLTQKPYKESTSQMPDEDYENEGLAWMERQAMLIQGITSRQFWERWKAADEVVYVVRFKKLEAVGLFYG